MKTTPHRWANAHLSRWLQTPGTQDQPMLFPAFYRRYVAYSGDFLTDALPNNYVTVAELTELLSPANKYKYEGSGYD